jgi:uncharacterized protein (DUF3084 family)
MREQVEGRLDALKREYEKGQLQLQQLQAQVGSMRDTLLRISGAVTVLEELLSSSSGEPSFDSNSTATQLQTQREAVTAHVCDGQR